MDYTVSLRIFGINRCTYMVLCASSSHIFVQCVHTLCVCMCMCVHVYNLHVCSLCIYGVCVQNVFACICAVCGVCAYSMYVFMFAHDHMCTNHLPVEMSCRDCNTHRQALSWRRGPQDKAPQLEIPTSVDDYLISVLLWGVCIL